MLFKNDFDDLNAKIITLEKKLKDEMIKDFSKIFKESGVKYEFFSGMGVYGFEKNKDTIDMDEKYLNYMKPITYDEIEAYDDADEVYPNDEKNKLLLSYREVIDFLHSEYHYFVSFDAGEKDYI